MSSLDQYSYCPCGNGSKIKFCECPTKNFAEMEKIHRMIVGEQNVAALDRINQNLQTTPSAPWLLAMKCQLLLQLKEIESLEETSAKFIRLQPDNPLAKLYRSLLAVIRGNTEEGASLLLQAIGDSTETLPALTPTVALNLLETMAKRGQFLSALLHAEMLMDMDDEIAKFGFQAHAQLASQTNANILSRESLPSPSEGDGTQYAERLAEADALLGGYRIVAAKTKLESIQREFGPQAPILQRLLYCQLMLADTESAAGTCKKLANVSDLPEPQRIYYQAMAYELGPRSNGAAVLEELCQYEIEDTGFDEKLSTCKNLVSVPVEQFKGLLTAILNEEVPPKACYLCVEPLFQEQFADVDANRTGSWLAFYGRQTDKPARLIALEPPRGPRRVLLEKVKGVIGVIGLKRELLETLPTTYASQIGGSVLVKKEIPAERSAEFRHLTRQYVIDSFLDYPFDCLGGVTPREASTDSSKSIALAGLLLHWQGTGTSGLSDSKFKELHKQLNLKQPCLDASTDVFDLVGGAAYFWTDLSTIQAVPLLQLMQSALSRGVSSLSEALVERSEQMQWPDEVKDSAEYTVLNLKAQLTNDPNEAEKLLRKIAEAAKKIGVPIGNAVLERVEILSSMGRGTEARMYLEQSLRENPEDPALLQFVQLAMMREQQMRARGGAMPSQPGGAAVSPSSVPASGIWTPGQAAAAPEEKGESKLWIPGQ